MSVELDPTELHFRRPFSKEVQNSLRLQNPNSTALAFKVKTTAPKQYCVRPNSGRIEAGGEVEVQVLLQAMKEDPPLDAKCRDKFLVQTVAITPDKDFNNQPALWAHVEQTDRSAIHEKKIRVAFDPAEATTPARGGVNGISHAANTPGGASPAQDMSTPSAPASTAPTSDSRPAGSTFRDFSNLTGRSSPTSGTSSGIAAALPTNTEDVKGQLEKAQAEISRLTSQLKEQGELRQRNVANKLEEKGYPGVAQAVAHPNQTAGVPLQWVGLLVLLSFLIAYFFF